LAIDRNKIAQQAERLVAQGKVLEAIVQYEMLVRDNPRDMNTINKIGDLYSRHGKKREAILQFNKIGEFYAKDGFFLKAIAIYKKITKLDPTCLEAYQRLADLYAQQGLVLEARSQYQMVAEQYLKAGDVKKAVGAYQSLVRVDPENLKHRGHLADLLAKDGRAGEAAEEYTRLGAELERKGKESEARVAYQKAGTAQPGSPAVVARLAASQAAAGDIEGAIKVAKEGLAKPGDHRELLALLADLQLKVRHYDDAQETYRKAIEAAPERTELTLRLARAQAERGRGDEAYETIAPHLAALYKQGHGSETLALLEKIVQLESGHVEAHLRLAEAYAAQKNEGEFGRCAKRALDLCIDRGEYFEGKRHAAHLLKLRPDDAEIRERLSLLQTAEMAKPDEPSAGPDGAAAPTTPLIPTVMELPPSQTLEPEDEDFITEHMTEADVFVKYGLGDRAVEQLVAVIERYPGHVPALLKLKEIHLEEGNREAARDQMARLVKAHLSANEHDAARQALDELRRFDPEGREGAELAAVLYPGSEPPRDVVMVQAAVAGGVAEEQETYSDVEEHDDEEMVVVDSEESEEEQAPSQEELMEVDALLGGGDRDEAVSLLRKLAEAYGSHPDIVVRMKAAVALKAKPAAPVKKAAPASEPAPQNADLSDLSDLASEIDAALAGDGAADQSLLEGVEATPEGHSLEEIVQAFRKGIEQQVDAEDFDTHYNLGIAYKEMGLMDEAIGEFQFAAKDAHKLVDCCSMLGICFREKGMSALAVKWYRKGLEAGASNDEETMLGMRYDLAELLVEMGEHRQAMELFTEVFGINSKYRDVASRMKELERQIAR